ncbi:hypothetical protein ACROYT_G035082 [Oculina patagonica]
MDLELNFRLARPNDFDKVLKLSEGIYDGHDYLPFRYHTWMKMENVAVMLAIYREKLVGLVVCSVVDDGRTWVARAGRTLKESRGKAQKLFPDNIILVEKIPFEPIRSNIDFLTMENDVYFAVEKCIDGALPRSVSFSLLSPRVKIAHWSVTVYTSDPVLYEAHLLHQLKRACEVIKGDFIFNSFHDKSLTYHGKRVLKERLQVEFEEELPVNLYEEDVMHQSHL